MIIKQKIDLGREEHFNILPSVEQYSNQLEYYWKTFITKELPGVNKKAENILLSVITKNDKSILIDIEEFSDDLGKKTTKLISMYTRYIMQVLGKIAECVIIDRCTHDVNCNIKFMNIATMKENIFNKYNELNYNKFVPFSPSHKFMILKENGIYRVHNVPDKNANHETKDIGWCNKENPMDQLRFIIPSTEILQESKIQIKTTINPEKLKLDKYITTPVIIFNLSDLGIDCIRNKYPKHNIFDAKDIDKQSCLEIDAYFRNITAYAIGYSSSFKINTEMLKDERLGYLFRAPIKHLLNYKPFEASGIISLIEDFKLPIAVYS